jgi:hypothetical protein
MPGYTSNGLWLPTGVLAHLEIFSPGTGEVPSLAFFHETGQHDFLCCFGITPEWNL